MRSDQDLQKLTCRESSWQRKKDQGYGVQRHSCQNHDIQEQATEEQGLHDQIEGFIHTQVVGRGLDERTARAYQMDLEHFYLWLEAEAGKKNDGYEERMETYLKYLTEERKLRFSTISRKQRVFRYYLSYLTKQGIVEGYRPIKVTGQPEEKEGSDGVFLTKKEIDLFFQTIQQEYERLDSDFRKRVCLRDQVMMGLLFYHRVEVSELLRMEVSDYDRKTAVLTVKRKREKDRQVYLFSKALQEQMAGWLDEHEYFEHGGEYHNRMFLSKLGKPLSMKMVINIFNKYRVKAGIEKECTPKDLKNGLGRYAEEVVVELVE